MANNKNALIRYQAIDRCLKNFTNRYDIEKLLEACNEALLDQNPHSSGVQKRQVYEDIKNMQDARLYDAPILKFKEGRKTYYRYEDSSFSINKQPLSEMEANQLRETIFTLSRFEGLPQFEWIDEIKARLEQSFHLKSEEKVISFDDNPYLKGKHFISELYQAIVNKQVLDINYQPFTTRDPVIFEIHPYFLKEYNNRWYLLGWNNQEGKLYNIALDRIHSIQTGKTSYIPNTTFNVEDHFYDVVGITVNNESQPQEIIIKVDESLWPYINTKPLHGSQKEIKGGNYKAIQIKVIPNYELEALILSHGEKLAVIEPEGFRNRIKTRAVSLYSNYS